MNTLLWADGCCRFPQRQFRRVFVTVRRPVPDGAQIVTAYTNGDVTFRSNRRTDGYHEAADLSSFRGVRAGDFVVHGLDILRGSVGVSDSTGAISSVCIVCEPRSSADPRYFAYVMRAQALSGLPKAMARGVREGGADFRRWDTLGELPLPVPTVEHQRAIADYLDTETTRIDAVITKKRRMVELLDARFWSWVTTSITDLNPGMAPLRRFIQRIADGPFGSSLTSSHYTDAGARVVRLGNIGFAEFKDVDRAFISMAHFADLQRHRVVASDLLIAGLGDSRNHVGRACVAPDLGDCIVKADCYCARLDPALTNPDFVALYLSSPLGAEQVALAARGTTRSRINLDIAKEILVPQISVGDQSLIVIEARRKRSATATTIRNLNRQIELLIERRQALITAAVTGELEIPGVAA